jgi:hypothetical protein
VAALVPAGTRQKSVYMPASLFNTSAALPAADTSARAWWLLFGLLAGLLLIGRSLQPVVASKSLVHRGVATPAARTALVPRLVSNASLAPASTL